MENSKNENIFEWQGIKCGNFPEMLPTFYSSADKKITLRIATFNCLADCYARASNFPKVKKNFLIWRHRNNLLYKIVKALSQASVDVVCLQEIDVDLYEKLWEKWLATFQFKSVFVRKERGKKDGLLIAFDANKFRMTDSEQIHFDELAKHGGLSLLFDQANLGLVIALETVQKPISSFVISTGHLFWDPSRQDVKLLQALYLVQATGRFRSKVAERTKMEQRLVVCGDFNSLPKSLVYELLVKGEASANELPKLLETLNCSATEDDENWPRNLPFQIHRGDRVSTGLPLVSAFSSYPFENEIAADDGADLAEAEYTNATVQFTGTLDYIFHEDTAVTLAVSRIPSLKTLPKFKLPCEVWPSDHLCLVADIAWTEQKF